MAIRTLIFAGLVAGLIGLGSCGSTETPPPRPQPSEARKKELLTANEILTACTAHDIEKVKALLGKNPALINAEDDAGATPLARAVGGLQPSAELVKFLLERGAKVEGSLKYGETPLQLAAMNGNKENVALLLAYGANVHARNRYGSTVMNFAAFRNQIEVADVLLAHGAEMSVSDAAAVGNMKKLGAFLRENPNAAKEKDDRGLTPLHWAVRNGHIDAVRLLLVHGASAFEEDRYGMTPCTGAREFKRTEIIQLMHCP